MFKVTGDMTIQVKVDGESTEYPVDGSEFDCAEGDWHHIGDGDHRYDAFYKYHGDNFDVSFEVTYIPGSKPEISPFKCEGDVEVLEDHIDVEYIGGEHGWLG